MFGKDCFQILRDDLFSYVEKLLFLLQLVLEEAFVLAGKIKKQTNLCMNARRVISMIQQISLHMKKLQNIDDNLMKNTGL